MSDVNFRLCTMADKANIVQFMDDNWGSKHVLLHCEEFFNHYYRCGHNFNSNEPDLFAQNSNEPLQFAVAQEDETILAVLGYIYTSSSKPVDVWVSIWCALKGKNGIGLELMSKLPELLSCRVMACNNIRPKTMNFYRFLGYTAERLPHYYRLSDCENYKVARVKNKKILPYHGNLKLTLISDFDELMSKFTPPENLRPFKDYWYIKRRYFNYPFKKYDVYGISMQESDKDVNNYCALLVTYTVNVNGTFVLRIADYIGNAHTFEQLGTAINGLMHENHAEYADCYCYGISSQSFANAGFCERLIDDENIIPNYLTPPLYENTEFYFFTNNTENFTMFKADGDGDRPNI